MHSLLERRVNYLLTSITKNLVLHGKEGLFSISRGVQYFGGYHEYIGNIMSTLGDVQYIGGLP